MGKVHVTTNTQEPVSKVRILSAAMYSSYYNLFRIFKADSGLELEGMREEFVTWLQSYHMPLYGLHDAVEKWRASFEQGE